MSDLQTVGWRLTLEPCGDMVAWSLLRRRAAAGTDTEVWSGIIRRATRAQELVSALTDPSTPGLADPVAEALGTRELGITLLPPVMREALASATSPASLTISARGWLTRVPWDALAVNQSGTRVVERCFVLGGLTPALLSSPPPSEPSSSAPASGQLWVVDPGPPDGRWSPLYPAGYPDELTQVAGSSAHLLPQGATFSRADLGEALRSRSWRSLVYFGHIGTVSDSPAGASLVLSDHGGPEMFNAHDWLRSPARWPAPARVALLGCGSDDAAPFEQAGLITAAFNAGAREVTGTRWSLPNTGGALRLLNGVAGAQASPAVIPELRKWQIKELALWRRTGRPDHSPVYWSSLVTYDRNLLSPGRSDG